MCKNLKPQQFIVAGKNATEMFVMDRQTYGRTDRQTQKDKTIYPLSRGNKYGICRRKSEMSFCDYCRSGEVVVMENLMQGIQTCIKANNNVVYTGATTV